MEHPRFVFFYFRIFSVNKYSPAAAIENRLHGPTAYPVNMKKGTSLTSTL